MNSTCRTSTSDSSEYSTFSCSDSISQSIVSFPPQHISSFTSTENICSNDITAASNFSLSDEHSNWKQVLSSESRRRRGRPSKQPKETVTSVVNAQALSDSDANYDYSPNHFWCPSCLTTYAASTCPIHTCFIQSDTVVSYAHFSLPTGLKLVRKRGRLCVILTQRLLALTKFGPVVAPSITGEELRQNPSWLPDCSFRVDVHGVDAESESAQYLHLYDESRCNWMMFVQRRECRTTPSHRIPEPNAVAYQQGIDGVFFITTRYIRPGEELVVTCAPPYAKYCGFIPYESVTSGHSDFLKKSVRNRAVICANASPPDEIHCFRCAVTFNCEDAFRIHCLGHPDELVQRGFLQTSTSSSTEHPGTHSGDGSWQHHSQLVRNRHSIYSNRILCCSLCSVEVDGLDSLIHHTDMMHSVLKPTIFKASLAATISADCTLVQPEISHMDVESTLGLDKQSLVNPTDIASVHFTGTCEPASEVLGVDDDDILVVDLNHASQNLLERPLLWAYGCGVCTQRFPNLLALEQHKQHTCIYAHPSSDSAGQLPTAVPRSSGSLTPPSKEHTVKQTRDSETVNAVNESVLLTAGIGEPISVHSMSLIGQVREGTMTDEARGGGIEFQHSANSVTAESSHARTSALSGSIEGHPIRLDFECDICWTRFRTRSAYSVHMRAHDCSNPRSFQVDNHCKSNGQITIKAGERYSPHVHRITRNKSRQLEKRGFFCCRVCNQRLGSQMAWRQHSQEHRRTSDHRYPCPICSADDISKNTKAAENTRVYDTFDQLQRHMRHVHCNQIFPCPYCPSVFGRRQALVSHLSCHTGQRDFTCPQCGRSFARKDNLQRHRKTHSDTNV